MNRLLLVALIACGCTDAPKHYQLEPVQMDKYTLSVPSHWERHELGDATSKRVEWDSVADKLSIVVIKTASREAQVAAGPLDAMRLLSAAQQSLPNARFGIPIAMTSAGGLLGATIEGEYTMPITGQVAHRVHAVFLDPQEHVFIHILFTALTDVDPGAIDTVIRSIRRGA